MPLCLGVSILLHGLLAVVLGVCLDFAPQPDVLATLDLSSVELSFAEQERETAAVAPMPAADNPRPPQPKADERPPEAKPDRPLQPKMDEVRFPEPREDVRLKTEAAKAEDGRRKPDDAPAPRQARLDAPPRPKRNIRPDYPKGARQRGEQGDVVLEIRVDASGAVDDVKVAVSSGFAELDAAAVRAAKAAKFSPARSGRESVASTARLKLQFKLK